MTGIAELFQQRNFYEFMLERKDMRKDMRKDFAERHPGYKSVCPDEEAGYWRESAEGVPNRGFDASMDFWSQNSWDGVVKAYEQEYTQASGG